MKICQPWAKPRLFLFLFLTLLSIFLLFDCKKSHEGKLSSAEEIEKQVPLEEKASAEKLSAKGLIIRTFPTNGGFTRKTDQPIFIYFSQAIRPADFTFEIIPPIKEWKVEWEREGKLAILNPGELFSVGVTYTLNVLISRPKTREKIEFTVYGPSSLDLIDKDEREKIIDIDQAWIYRFQAIYESFKLPAKYRSLTPLTCATPVLREFVKIKGRLKKETLEFLEPYLVPPTHPKSIFSIELEDISHIKENTRLFPSLFAQDKNPSIWEKPIKCETAPVKIWFRKGERKIAEEAKGYIDQMDMYNRFLKLMEKEPPSDENEQFNGGDGNLDIYLVKLDAYGECVDYKASKVTPSYILINKFLRGNRLLSTLAHELFHSFQCAYDSKEESWWAEGTAVWAEDFIDRKHNLEQGYIPEAFYTYENRLETITDNDGLHPYGIYLFPFYLTQYHDKESVGAVWKRCGDTDALTAIENEFKDFKQIFADFSYKCFDLGPTEGSFKDVGGNLFLWIHHRAKETILTSDEREYEIEFTLPPLAAKYFFFKNICKAEKTPHITFDLEGIKDFESLVIKAIIDPLGEPREEDWTGLSERSFCINREEEKFRQLAIVVASSDKTNPIETDITVKVEAGGCVESDATLIWTLEKTISSYDEHSSGYSRSFIKENATLRALLKLDPTRIYEGKKVIAEHYDVVDYSILGVSLEGEGESKSQVFDCVESCQEKIWLLKWDINKPGPEKNTVRIEYDRKSGKVKSVSLGNFSLNADALETKTCEHKCRDRSWADKEEFVGPYFMVFGDMSLLEVVNGDIKSPLISGSLSWQEQESPGNAATLNYEYKIIIQKRKSK